jgi:outer membrane protein assembly factor BamD
MKLRTVLFSRWFLMVLLLGLAACGKSVRDDEVETLPVDKLYDAAKTSLTNGNYDRAQRYFKRLIARFPFGEYTDKSEQNLAFAQYKMGQSDEALSTINRFIKQHPTHANVDYAYYLRGLINFDRKTGFFARYLPEDIGRDNGTAKQAFLDFAELLKRFPDSKYSPDARQRMLYLRNSLAAAELNVARYYFRRGAYIGAANRAKNVIETYQQTPQAADALAVLAECYRREGQTTLAADTEAVLKLNDPQHPYLADHNVFPSDNKSWLRSLWPF